MSLKESNHVNFKLQHDSVVNMIWSKYNLPNAYKQTRKNVNYVVPKAKNVLLGQVNTFYNDHPHNFDVRILQ